MMVHIVGPCIRRMEEEGLHIITVRRPPRAYLNPNSQNRIGMTFGFPPCLPVPKPLKDSKDPLPFSIPLPDNGSR